MVWDNEFLEAARRWFDYQRKADGSMPVGKADECRGNSNEVQSSPVIPTTSDS